MVFNFTSKLFKQFNLEIYNVEKIQTHGGSIRIYVKKTRTKINKNVKSLLKEEEKFGIKKYKTYKNFADKIYKIKSNVINNLNKIKRK